MCVHSNLSLIILQFLEGFSAVCARDAAFSTTVSAIRSLIVKRTFASIRPFHNNNKFINDSNIINTHNIS